MLAEKDPKKSKFPVTAGNEWPMSDRTVKVNPTLPDGKAWPKISIVTPSFNQGDYLEKTIRSVLLQGYPNLEYVIIDGGSRDQSIEVIKKYEPWIDTWVSEKDRGQSHAINKGLSLVTGELLGWLNSDDFYLPGALFHCAKAYLENPEYGAYYGRARMVNEKGAITYVPEPHQVTRESLFEWSFGKNFMQPSCLFTQKAWQDCAPLDENIHIALDVDLWLKIAAKYRFRQIDEFLSIALAHEDAKTTAQRHHMLLDLSFVLLKHGGNDAARRTLEKLCDRLVECESKLKILQTAEEKRIVNRVRRTINKARRIVAIQK